MNMMKKIGIVIGILIIAGGISFAFDLSFYNSFKTFCMGETFTGIANDENALYYNPAGLTNNRGWVSDFLNLNVDLSKGSAVAVMNALAHTNEIKTILKNKDAKELVSYFISQYSKDLLGMNDTLIRSRVYLGYEGNNFAAMGSVLGQGYIQTLISNDVVPSISVSAKAGIYLQASIAAALNFSDLKVSVGGTYKYGYLMPHIYSINKLPLLMISSSTFDPNMEYEEDSNIDMGMKLSFRKITFGALWRDVWNSTLPDVRIGMGYTWKTFSVGMDFEKIFDTKYSFFRKLHAGLSYTLSEPLTLFSVNYYPLELTNIYVGLSGGWITGGIKLNLSGSNVYIGTYVLNYGYHAGYDYQRMYTIGFGT